MSEKVTFSKKRLFFQIVIFILLIAFLVQCKPQSKNTTLQQTENIETCPNNTEAKTVRGISLEPLIKNGEDVKVIINYYKCYAVERNDIIVYQYAGNQNPLIKIVKGMPNDKFSLKLNEDSTNWYILLNDEILKNSEGKPYLINSHGAKVLSLYINDYKGIIPQNAYLILGNLASGSLDSTAFGLISKDDIIGKAEIK